MGNRENFEKKLQVLRAIENSQIKKPHHIPVDVYIQEADILYHWAREDIGALTAAGLPRDLIDDLPIRCGALIEAEARWQTKRNTTKKNSLDWKKQFPLAYDLRNRLLRDFRFAFRDHPAQIAAVKSISQGESHADMIQDLNDLAVLGKANRQLLETIDFDMSLLDTAAQTSEEMSVLLAKATKERLGPEEAKKIRDQAYTHLKEAVDKIRSHGQYVFHENKDRFIGYRSNYIRKIKRKQGRKSG